jgi:hypothetical protein
VADANAGIIGIRSVFFFDIGGGVGGARVDQEVLGGVHFVVTDDSRTVPLSFVEGRELVHQELTSSQEC